MVVEPELHLTNERVEIAVVSECPSPAVAQFLRKLTSKKFAGSPSAKICATASAVVVTVVESRACDVTVELRTFR